MTTFDKREEGFEKKFAHDEELQFKANARRDKMLAHWAAGLLGKSGADEEAYVGQILAAEISKTSEDVVFLKIRKDFDAAGVVRSDHQIRRTMDEFLAKAKAEIKTSG